MTSPTKVGEIASAEGLEFLQRGIRSRGLRACLANTVPARHSPDAQRETAWLETSRRRDGPSWQRIEVAAEHLLCELHVQLAFVFIQQLLPAHAARIG